MRTDAVASRQAAHTRRARVLNHCTRVCVSPGYKGFGTGHAATLEIHGQVGPVSWTNLAATAFAGSNTITLQRSVVAGGIGWRYGHHIVITTTDFYKEHTEVRAVGGCWP